MSKSYVGELLEVYLNVFRDILYAYPNDMSELELDWLRLTRLTRERGLPFLTVDLPALGKHLDRCLDEGAYRVSGLPGGRRVSGTVPIPHFMRGLYLRIFESHGRLKEYPDYEAILFLRQVLYLAKELPLQCSDQAVRTEVRSFLATDRLLPVPHALWAKAQVEDSEIRSAFQGFAREQRYAERCDPQRGHTDGKLLAMLDTISSVVSITLGPYRPAEWRFGHGPGSVSNVPSGKNRYRFVSWTERLETVYPLADCAFHNYASWADDTHRSEYADSEPAGKLLDVVKTFTKPRLIATEPSEHMWCQKNIWHYIKTRVERSWISGFVKFDDQTQNQQLCVRGSVDGSLATVDLSAASDRVSCHCVGNMFKANLSLLRALRATRTRYIKQGQLGDEPELVELRKFSTMGNATTFPVETLVFASVALAAALVSDGVTPEMVSIDRLGDYIGQVSVFGDDIIVPVRSVGFLVRLLEILDFKVNVNKSFSAGKFRESCGVDCFAGQNITPVKYHGPYQDTQPASYASTIEVSNNFYKKFLVHTSNHLRQSIRRYRVPLVHMDAGFLGWKSFVSPSERHPTHKVRWNRDLQRTEIFVPCLFARAEKTPIRDDSALLQFFTEEPDPAEKWESGWRGRPRQSIKTRWVPIAQIEMSEMPAHCRPVDVPVQTSG